MIRREEQTEPKVGLFPTTTGPLCGSRNSMTNAAPQLCPRPLFLSHGRFKITEIPWSPNPKGILQPTVW